MNIKFSEQLLQAPILTEEGWQYATGEMVTINGHNFLLFTIPYAEPIICLSDIESGQALIQEDFPEAEQPEALKEMEQSELIEQVLAPHVESLASKISQANMDQLEETLKEFQTAGEKKFGPKPEPKWVESDGEKYEP